MKRIAVLSLVLGLQGCATVAGIQSYIPSFWDDNQSAKITDVRLDIEKLDCKLEQHPQVAKIRNDLKWFELYSESKGPRQQDVQRLIRPMQDTVEDWYKRSSQQKDNAVYCELKKKVLVEQSSRAAKAVLGRF